MTYFNWNKFISKDCKILINWLERQGYCDQTSILLKIVALILKGEQDAYSILTTACSNCSLRELFLTEAATVQDGALDENIVKLIGYWVHQLPRDPWLLGEIYAKLALGQRARANYYTPRSVIQFIVAHTIEQCDVVATPFVRILDPACGCGYFLLAAYDVLWRKFLQHRSRLTECYPTIDWSDAGIHKHIISCNLWGADIDPLAAAITCTALNLKYSDCYQAANVIVYDSLVRPDASAGGLVERLWHGGYDYIIGNPPYLSFGLRGTTGLNAGYRQYLRESYIHSAEYKLSYYALFLERGIELLNKDGQLGYIIPDSFLLGRYYSKIRRYIMDHTAIQLIAHLNFNVFANASTGYSVICILRKADVEQRLANWLDIYRMNDDSAIEQAQPVCRYEQQYFNTQPFTRFRIYFDLNTRAIIETIEQGASPLRHYASGHTGIRSLTKQCEIVAQSPTSGYWRAGLISGSQIERYRLTYKDHWLNIDPALLYKGGWKKEIVEQRKILLRQTGDTIIAAIDDQGFYHLNNLHSFVVVGTEITLDYLLLILNSRLMAFYYHVTTMEYGRPMAQTDIETLERLPIVVNDEINAQAPELVATMADCVKKAQYADGTAAMKSFDDYLNQLIYRIYHLTDDEIACIERYEACLGKRSYRKKRRQGVYQ